MLRMRWNLRMSSLPASRATPTPNATTPSAVATMCFIVRAFLYLPGRAFPAQILSVRSEFRPLMFISPGWLPPSVGYRVEGRPDHGLRSRFWRVAPTRHLNLGRASESCLYAPGSPDHEGQTGRRGPGGAGCRSRRARGRSAAPSAAVRRSTVYPVLSSGPTSLPVGPVDSRDVQIGVAGLNKVGPGGLSFRNLAIPAW
jgi:hypothetical protein